MLKQVSLTTATSIADLAAVYSAKTAEVDVAALAGELKSKIAAAVEADDLEQLLVVWDRKEILMALASRHFRNCKVEVFTSWVTRAIQSTRDEQLKRAIRDKVPTIAAESPNPL